MPEIAACLLLKLIQSVLVNKPLFEADELGRLNVCVDPIELILKSVPPEPANKV